VRASLALPPTAMSHGASAGPLTASPSTHHVPPDTISAGRSSPPSPRIRRATHPRRHTSDRTERFGTLRHAQHLRGGVSPGLTHAHPAWMRAAVGCGSRTHPVLPCSAAWREARVALGHEIRGGVTREHGYQQDKHEWVTSWWRYRDRVFHACPSLRTPSRESTDRMQPGTAWGTWCARSKADGEHRTGVTSRGDGRRDGRGIGRWV
jgi:hypothetical protein